MQQHIRSVGRQCPTVMLQTPPSVPDCPCAALHTPRDAAATHASGQASRLRGSDQHQHHHSSPVPNLFLSVMVLCQLLPLLAALLLQAAEGLRVCTWDEELKCWAYCT